MKTAWIVALLSLATLAACGHTEERRVLVAQHQHGQAEADDDVDEDEDDADDGRTLALADVPRVVLDAAARAVPAATWTAAEVETEDGVLVYELSGTLDGDEVEIEVSADGKVLEFERG
jgi:uncharacterized membrane protein YkoI